MTRSFTAILIAVYFAGTGFAGEDRIRQPIEAASSVPLQGNIPPQIRRDKDRGVLAPDVLINGLRLVLAPTGPQRADLERLLEEQRDRSSPDYRNWLTPEQFGERFGLSENDLALISSWLQSEGFAVEKVARARNWISFNGTAAQIARVFHTELRRVAIDGEEHVANLTEPWIPAALGGIVTAIRGLDSFHPRPLHAKVTAHPDFDASSGSHYLGPADLAEIYDIQALYNAGFDGTGQNLAIAGQTDISLTDLRAFRSQFNLPARDPQLVLFGADPGMNQDDQIEASLDLEWSGAVARGATVIYAYSQDVFESLQYVIDQNLAPVVSVSYGGCELTSSTSFRGLAQQANAEGITWMNAAGDSGAAGCDSGGERSASQGPAAMFPADISEVTAVGGTEFNEASGTYWSAQNRTNSESALSYIPEKAWNDSSLGKGLAAGGGGPSLVYPKPWWQTGPGVPNDYARDVPDVALTASGSHDAYMIFARGELLTVGGTSASSPSFAGIVSILNQFLIAKGEIAKPGLGNINPALYNLAQNTTGLFHDITAGNNIVPCAPGSKGCATGTFGYEAGTGYDLATGLGSVDALNLVTNWSNSQPVTGTITTLEANPASVASSASVQLIATVKAVSGGNPPRGTVTFASGNTELGLASVTGSGTVATALLTVHGGNLASGVDTVTAGFFGSAGFSNSTAAATVSVGAPSAAAPVQTSMLVTSTPASVTPSASLVLTATVKPASGVAVPAGTVSFATGGKSLGSANLAASGANGVATLTVKGSSLVAGANTIAANYTSTGKFGTSIGSVVVTVLTATSTTVTATSTKATATVKALSGSTAPTGNVTFLAGIKTLGTATLSNSVATLPVSSSSLAGGSIMATYGGNGSFAESTSTPVAVTVVLPPVATSTVVTASPSLLAQNASTVLTAIVKAAGGNVAPTGYVSFVAGSTVLGNSVISSGTAALAITGSSLAVGANSITANYAPQGNFIPSSSPVLTVNVKASPITPTIVVSAAPGAEALTTVLTATLKASGSAVPAGSVTFSLGTRLLGSAVLSGASGSLTLNNGVLTAGKNLIGIYYPGAAGFTSSTASAVVVIP
jgi:Pro-kumamolisin, activation domain/Bacterial Ig-like domain (group 3)